MAAEVLDLRVGDGKRLVVSGWRESTFMAGV
jgi:hypothetical protein